LLLDGATQLQLKASQPGHYALFLEHTPEEFNLRLYEAGGMRCEPTSQHYFNAGHTHDDEAGSLAFEFEGDLDAGKFDAWLSVLLRTEGANLYRMKGILAFAGDLRRMHFHGVHMLFDSEPGALWGTEPRHNRLVFIGRNLDRELLEDGLQLCRQ